MHLVQPKVYLVGRPALDYTALKSFLETQDAGGPVVEQLLNYTDPDRGGPAQKIIEAAGRLCYRSWEPGLNKNVTKVREDPREYLENILKSRHGSVLEHAQWNFIIDNVSRVFTHEIVRHRIGTAISQESLRYVRLEELGFWLPEWAQCDPAFVEQATALIERMEQFQTWMAEYFELDKEGVHFSEKKAKTSFMRRFAPEGLATRMLWSANCRALRHVIEMRTDSAAEEEMRIVAKQIGELMVEEAPALFGDYKDDGKGGWTTEYRKV